MNRGSGIAVMLMLLGVAGAGWRRPPMAGPSGAGQLVGVGACVVAMLAGGPATLIAGWTVSAVAVLLVTAREGPLVNLGAEVVGVAAMLAFGVLGFAEPGPLAAVLLASALGCRMLAAVRPRLPGGRGLDEAWLRGFLPLYLAVRWWGVLGHSPAARVGMVLAGAIAIAVVLSRRPPPASLPRGLAAAFRAPGRAVSGLEWGVGFGVDLLADLARGSGLRRVRLSAAVAVVLGVAIVWGWLYLRPEAATLFPTEFHRFGGLHPTLHSHERGGP